MRKMKNSSYGTVVNVVSLAMTSNFWEYFITDNHFTDDIVTAVVKGFETEMGDISLKEIKPYLMCQSSDLRDVMPAPGWEWVD
jgi:hypothetical protein